MLRAGTSSCRKDARFWGRDAGMKENAGTRTCRLATRSVIVLRRARQHASCVLVRTGLGRGAVVFRRSGFRAAGLRCGFQQFAYRGLVHPLATHETLDVFALKRFVLQQSLSDRDDLVPVLIDQSLRVSVG